MPCCEWLALPPEAMVSSQSKLPLRAMSASMTMQQQGVDVLWLILPPESMGTSLVGDQVDVQGLGRTGPAPHWLWHSEELVPPLTSCTWPRRDCGAEPGGWGVGVLALRPQEPENLTLLAVDASAGWSSQSRAVLESLP